MFFEIESAVDRLRKFVPLNNVNLQQKFSNSLALNLSNLSIWYVQGWKQRQYRWIGLIKSLAISEHSTVNPYGSIDEQGLLLAIDWMLFQSRGNYDPKSRVWGINDLAFDASNITVFTGLSHSSRGDRCLIRSMLSLRRS